MIKPLALLIFGLCVADQMEQLIQAGNREQALITFLREIVMISPEEVEIMKTRPS